MPLGALRLSGRVREFKGLGTAVCLTVAMLGLAGCGLLPFGSGNETRTQSPPPPQTESSLQAQTAPEVTQTPETVQSPADDPPTGNNSPDGPGGYVQVPAPAPPPQPLDPVLAAGPLELGPDGAMGSLGLNLGSYFDENEGPEKRLAKLERAVAAMQRDLRTLAPPLRRLITVERDIQTLVAQLTKLAATRDGPAPQATGAPYGAAYAQAPPSTVAPKQTGGRNAPQAAGPVTIKKLRLGEHPGFTRIVLDVSGPATYRYDLDNAENLLVIELPDAGWSGATQGQLQKSPILASWTAMPANGGGSRIVLQLKKQTAVSYESAIKANGYKDYRIVIDLKK